MEMVIFLVIEQQVSMGPQEVIVWYFPVHILWIKIVLMDDNQHRQRTFCSLRIR